MPAIRDYFCPEIENRTQAAVGPGTPPCRLRLFAFQRLGLGLADTIASWTFSPGTVSREPIVPLYRPPEPVIPPYQPPGNIIPPTGSAGGAGADRAPSDSSLETLVALGILFAVAYALLATSAGQTIIEWITHRLIPWVTDHLVPWISNHLVPWVAHKLIPWIRDLFAS